MSKYMLDKQSLIRSGIREIDIDEEGGYVRLKPLSAGKVVSFQKSIRALKDDPIAQQEMMLQAMAYVIVDGEGNLLFTEEDVTDIPFPVYTRIMPIMMEMLNLNVASSSNDSDSTNGSTNESETNGGKQNPFVDNQQTQIATFPTGYSGDQSID